LSLARKLHLTKIIITHNATEVDRMPEAAGNFYTTMGWRIGDLPGAGRQSAKLGGT
jgi:hypothetical protein